jgi:hypothetical protein
MHMPLLVYGGAAIAALCYRVAGHHQAAVCAEVLLRLLLLLLLQMWGLVWVTLVKQKQRAFGCGGSRSLRKEAKQ